MASGTSPRTARSASGSATRTPPGGTAPLSRTRRAAAFYGYKIHAAVCAATGLPLAWRVETAQRQRVPLRRPASRRPPRSRLSSPRRRRRQGLRRHPRLRRVRGARLRAGHPAPWREGQADRHAHRASAGDCSRASPATRSGSATSTVAAPPLSASSDDLKHDYGLAPLRVRGLERVQLHADLTILARLGQVLIRAREDAARSLRREAARVPARAASSLSGAGANSPSLRQTDDDVRSDPEHPFLARCR